jgi:hypothetical protein
MNRKSLFVLSGISVVAVSALFVSAMHQGAPIIPGVNAASSKIFTFDSAVGAKYWSLNKWEQKVATGQGTPIESRIELPNEKYAERGFGLGSLFYYKTNDSNGSFNFSFGVNNLQGFEFTFKTANSGWNMSFAAFHAVIDYQDGNGATVYQENYDLVNEDEVDEDSDLHANTPITYSWARTQEFVGDAIRKVVVNVSYEHMNRISMDHVTVSWNC